MAGESAAEIEKRVKALNKKLKQIEALKEKDAAALDDAAREKIASEKVLKQEVKSLEAQLKSGAAAAPKAAPKAAAAAGYAAAKAPVAEAAPAPEPAAPAAAEAQELSEEDKAKRIKAINKKLRDIERLREKGIENLDAEAKAKVAAEAALENELAKLEGRAEDIVEVGADGAPANDPHRSMRRKALEPPPADIVIYCDDETEKRFKALQKKLRDIGKLREKPPEQLDKLQKEKLTQEEGLIKEIQDIRKSAVPPAKK
eukprot:TRINITY_DN8579_c0_g2_i1.p1 TRINITY_DN8579_c0_g2~~TRINITY_DN8579_c0_g2_i1.p1  ORF type:complete len:258 (+),score=136.41 TRINITY_DN8579_c0_g2_i1:192-965(+)